MPHRAPLALVFAVPAAVVVAPAAAPAQNLPPIPIFTDKTPDGALEDSIKRKRLLLLVPADDRAPTWTSPTVAEWVAWHAVAVRWRAGVDEAANPKMTAAMNECSMCRGETWVLKNGRPYRRVPSENMLKLLLNVDIVMDKLRAIDPVWVERHEQLNPEPPPPPKPEPLYKSASDGGVLVSDHAEGDPARPVDVFQRLKVARSRAALGATADATGYYTWLWERIPELEPSMAAARLTWLASEMKELARTSAPTRDHFRILRDRMWERCMWWTLDDVQEWATLNSIVGDEAHTLEYFMLYLEDPTEGSIVPRSYRSALTLLSEMPDWTDPAKIHGDAVDRLDRFAARAGDAIPATAGGDERMRKQVVGLRHRIVLDEGCRLYAACLAAGDEAEAMRAAGIVLRAHDTAEARIALVATAIAAEQPRPAQQLAWLNEARERGKDHPRLRELLSAPPAP